MQDTGNRIGRTGGRQTKGDHGHRLGRETGPNQPGVQEDGASDVLDRKPSGDDDRDKTDDDQETGEGSQTDKQSTLIGRPTKLEHAVQNDRWHEKHGDDKVNDGQDQKGPSVGMLRRRTIKDGKGRKHIHTLPQALSGLFLVAACLFGFWQHKGHIEKKADVDQDGHVKHMGDRARLFDQERAKGRSCSDWMSH